MYNGPGLKLVPAKTGMTISPLDLRLQNKFRLLLVVIVHKHANYV